MSDKINNQQKTTAETMVTVNNYSNNTVKNQNCQVFDLSVFEIVDGKVNLTKICQHFGKNINDWTKTQSAKKYIKAFSLKKADTNIIVSLKGGNNTQGSWTLYREVALKLAEWISVDFEIWASEQIDTLLQTGKVELTSTKPDNILDVSTALANQVLGLVEQIKQQQVENARKDTVIDTQRVREDHLITLKAKEYKTVQTERKAELGREINLLVSKIYYKDAGADYRQAHSMAHDDYARATGKSYQGAIKSTYESKQDYLQFLKSKNKNFLQRVLGI